MAASDNQLRVVLIGKTGNGKSATGNSLLDSRSTFESKASGASITKDCKAGTRQLPDDFSPTKSLLIVDTPGFFDTDPSVTNESVEKKIASQVFEMTTPGVHAFLIVLRIGRFSPEEQQTVDFIKKIFGDGAEKYCIIVFTGSDQLEGETLQDFIRSSPPALKTLVTACKNRIFAMNNMQSGQQLQRNTKELIRMINGLVQKNGGRYYTNAEYQRIAQKRREEQRQREEAEEKKKKAEQDAIIARTQEEERRKAKQREQELRERQREAERRANEAEARAARQACSSPYYSGCDHGSGGSGLHLASLLHGMSLASSMGEMYSSRPSASASRQRGAHGGRFTGEFMVTRGSADGQEIFEGPRGGRYYMNASGNKTYIR